VHAAKGPGHGKRPRRAQDHRQHGLEQRRDGLLDSRPQRRRHIGLRHRGQPIGAAMDMNASGHADLMLAGGAEAAMHPPRRGLLRRHGRPVARNDAPGEGIAPFDLNRDGFVIGEGAGVLVLETYEGPPLAARGSRRAERLWHDLRRFQHRGAPIPEGTWAAKAMEIAVGALGLEPR